MCFPLKEEREEGEGESISPLGAEQEAFRECFGLRWAKRQLLLSVVERIVHALRVFGFYCHRYLLPLKRERRPKGHQDLLWERNRGLRGTASD